MNKLNKTTTLISLLMGVLIPNVALAQSCDAVLKGGVFDTVNTATSIDYLKISKHEYCKHTFDNRQSATAAGFDYVGVFTGYFESSNYSKSQEKLCKSDWSKVEFNDDTTTLMKQSSKLILDAWTACVKNKEGVVFTYKAGKVSYAPSLQTPANNEYGNIQLIAKLNGTSEYKLKKRWFRKVTNVSPDNAIDCKSSIGSLLPAKSVVITCTRKFAGKISVAFNPKKWGGYGIFIPALIKELDCTSNSAAKDCELHKDIRDPIPIRALGGADWGDWGSQDDCPDQARTNAFRIKYETNQGPGVGGGHDDTGLNGIQLRCVNMEREEVKTISSSVQKWGIWSGWHDCGEKNLAGYSLQMEPNQGSADDSAVINVKFACRSTNINAQPIPMGDYISVPYQTPSGKFYWLAPRQCPIDMSFCGIKTRVQDEQGDSDDRALTDVQFKCCSMPR